MVKPRRTCLELQNIVEISCFGIGYVNKLGDCLDGCSIGNVDLWLFLVVFQVLFIGGLLMPCQPSLLLLRDTYCHFCPYANIVWPLWISLYVKGIAYLIVHNITSLGLHYLSKSVRIEK